MIWSSFNLRGIYAKFGESGILMYFDPATKSPISMLELGAFYNKAVVICPEGFWRKGNIDIFCDEFNVKQVPDLQSAVEHIIFSGG